MQRLYTDLMLAAAGAPVRYFPTLAAAVAEVAGRMNTARAAEAARWLTRQRALATHP